MYKTKRLGTKSPNKCRTSAGRERSLIETDSVDVVRLVCVIGNGRLSVKAMMEVLELKGREKFLNLYLNPAIQQGFVTMLYPNKPRQKYLLMVKGLALYGSCQK